MRKLTTKDLLSFMVECKQSEYDKELHIKGSCIRQLHQKFCEADIECDLSGYAFKTVAYDYPSDIVVSNTEIIIRNKNVFMRSSEQVIDSGRNEFDTVRRLIEETWK